MSTHVLEISNLNAFYGRAHVLQDISFTVDDRPVAIVGRNGMGKSTLCQVIMGMLTSARGSVRFQGRELMGKAPYQIARQGLGFVPQGRRLFPSLSTDEHLQIIPRRGNGSWSPKRIYETFPKLAARKHVGAGQLSGGEQQMLAIGRALLTNPKLLIMDEPSEGLAPNIVESVIDTIRKLAGQGVGLLVVEQNLGVAIPRWGGWLCAPVLPRCPGASRAAHPVNACGHEALVVHRRRRPRAAFLSGPT